MIINNCPDKVQDISATRGVWKLVIITPGGSGRFFFHIVWNEKNGFGAITNDDEI